MRISEFRCVVSIALFMFMASGCATTQRQPASAKTQNSLKEICAKNGVQWEWDQVSQVVTLRYRGAKAEVLVGSDIVLLGRERITLSSSVRTVRSAVFVPPDFQSKVIRRLRQTTKGVAAHKYLKVREIVIDAGHGGKDPGAIGHAGTQEKKIVLDISNRLKKILQSRGIKVRMTRTRDEFISLQKRTEIASQSKADLFVSIHANASPVRGVHGLEVFTAKNLNIMDNDAAVRRKNKELMFQNLSMKRGETNVEKIVLDMLYNNKQADAKSLAERLSKNTARAIKTKNRGHKGSRFYVLRNTMIPAVLVEVGFLTNPKERRLLETGSYRQRVARGLAESILAYANGQ